MTKVENMKNTAYMLEKRSQMMLEQAKADGTVSPAEEKFIELLHHESFSLEFSNCASLEAMKELLERNGVDFTMDEMKAILIGAGTIFQKVEENNGELSEEDLEQVAGGWSWKGFFIGMVAGAVIAAAMVASAAIMVGTWGAGTPAAVIITDLAIGAAAGMVIGGGIGGAIGD